VNTPLAPRGFPRELFLNVCTFHNEELCATVLHHLHCSTAPRVSTALCLTLALCLTTTPQNSALPSKQDRHPKDGSNLHMYLNHRNLSYSPGPSDFNQYSVLMHTLTHTHRSCCTLCNKSLFKKNKIPSENESEI